MNKTNNRSGGMAVLKKYGNDHFREIGRKGGRKTHSLYIMYPVDLNKFIFIPRNAISPRIEAVL